MTTKPLVQELVEALEEIRRLDVQPYDGNDSYGRGQAAGWSDAAQLASDALTRARSELAGEFPPERLEAMARAYEESLLGPFASKIELGRNGALERRIAAMTAAVEAGRGE